MRTMTSKQRLMAAIHHQEADLVPVSPRIHVWLKDNYGCNCWLHSLHLGAEFDYDPLIYLPSPYKNHVGELTASCEDLSDVKVELHVERHPDHTEISRVIHTPAGRLSDRLTQHKPGAGYGSDPNPHWHERLVKGPEDLPKLHYLLPRPAADRYSDITAIQEEVGERGLVNLYINSALDHQAGWCMEIDDFMVACIQQPDFIHDLLRIFQDHTLAETKAALEAGVEVIYTPWYFASLSAGWSPRMYQTFFLPLVKEHAGLIHAMGGLYHYYDDGACTKILPWLAEAEVDILSTVPAPPAGDVDLRSAKKICGDRICLNGNIDLIHVIANGTPELIEEKVREAISAAAPGGGFILGTSDSIRDAPRVNVEAFFQAARRFGSYEHLGAD